MKAIEKPLVSIIIPVYNVKDFVEDCVISVMNQSYENLQIICVDDKGSDDSISIVMKMQKLDSRIEIVENESNLGLALSRNRGLQAARGDYIYYLDSDDYLDLMTIERMVEVATRDPKIDVVVAGVECFLDIFCHKGAEKDLVNKEPYLNPTMEEEFLQVDEDNALYVFKNIPCIACQKLFKMSFINQHLLRFISRNCHHEDNGFFIKLVSAQPRIAILKEKSYKYRIRNNSIMSDARLNHEKREAHLKLCILDAMQYLKSQNKYSYMRITKDLYWRSFTKFKSKWLSLYLGTYEKRLVILGITIFKQSTKDGKTMKISFLGIPLCKYELF